MKQDQYISSHQAIFMIFLMKIRQPEVFEFCYINPKRTKYVCLEFLFNELCDMMFFSKSLAGKYCDLRSCLYYLTESLQFVICQQTGLNMVFMNVMLCIGS